MALAPDLRSIRRALEADPLVPPASVPALLGEISAAWRPVARAGPLAAAMP